MVLVLGSGVPEAPVYCSSTSGPNPLGGRRGGEDPVEIVTRGQARRARGKAGRPRAVGTARSTAQAWHELLRAFIGVKELHISAALSEEELSCALQVEEPRSDPGLLPGLQELVTEFEWEHTDNPFGSFIDARRITHHPLRRRLPMPPPPRVESTLESTQPRDTSPELSSDEETGGETRPGETASATTAPRAIDSTPGYITRTVLWRTVGSGNSPRDTSPGGPGLTRVTRRRQGKLGQ
ncbi:hypothetical protein EDB85DRAFT_1890072 [Lactarius pseudohatsudake]|nr:hypothetical protein EDB85DRAFT_1890072 [Lactarius pseudohatsudake]